MSSFQKPNLRKMFIPDPGTVWLDADLVGADAQVVAWEANDELMKSWFKSGLDVHGEDARLHLNRLPVPAERRVFKNRGHATRYGASPRGLAERTGMLVHEADLWQRRYFQIHPAIPEWHKRINAILHSSDPVIYTPFGGHFRFYGRTEKLLPEALAYVPQRTVATVCSRAGVLLHEANIPWLTMLLQVHDSLDFLIPRTHFPERHRIRDILHSVVIPYEDPLTIPWSVKASTSSWGEVKAIDWVD